MKILNNSPFTQKEICQVGIVVRNIEQSAKLYASLFGADLPLVEISDPFEKAHTIYKGQPTEARAKLAFIQVGSVTIELIEPVGQKSTWFEFLEKKGEGMHHIAIEVNDLLSVQKQLFDTFKMETIQSGDYDGGRYAYLDGEAQYGLIIELLENL